MPCSAPDPRRIAENISRAWYSHASHDTEHLEIPLGAVAALTLVQPVPGEDADTMAGKLRALDDEDLVKFLQQIWCCAWMTDPSIAYLVDTAGLLHHWLDENPNAKTLAAVRKVLHAALDSGLTRITGYDDPSMRSEADVLGYVLTEMRASGARKGLAEYHTPGPVADMMARMTIGDQLPEAGFSFHEPAAGTGGMMRAAAEHIRALGGNPAHYTWVIGDINPLAVALCAVNAIVWGLGPDVLVYCANALSDPLGPNRAAERRAAVREHQAEQMELARGAAVYINAAAMVEAAVSDLKDAA